jgi:uncharacterized protein YndB with AHSA1/START domain
MEPQWSNFKLRVNVKTSPAQAYQAWTTPAGLESWFLRKAIFTDGQGIQLEKNDVVKPGDTYAWYWHGYPDSVVEKGKVVNANGKDLMCFTFSMGCPVTIFIYEESNETIVELVESDLPTDTESMLKHYVGDSRGWIFYLTNLKSLLEGGIDLRNRKLELTNVITS